LPADGKSPVNT